MSIETRSFDEVLTIKNGANQKKVISSKGPYPIYGSGGVMGFANDYLCPENTTIIGRKGSINNPIFVTEKFWNVDTAFGLIAKENLNPKYLYYFCLQYNFLKHNKATTLPSLTKEDLKKIQIPLPPLAEQQRIADLLDAADALRQKDKALLEKYEALGQSLFLELFGDPVKNEKGWEKVEFGKTVKNLDNRRVPVKSSDRNDIKGIYPYYGASGIIDYVDEYIFDGNFLLIGEDGNNLVSRSTDIAFIVQGKCWVNNHAHVLESLEITNLTFLKYYFNSIDLKPFISGSAQPKLNRKNLDSILISLPPLELQNHFASQIELIEQQKAKVKANFVKSEELFQGLLGESFG